MKQVVFYLTFVTSVYEKVDGSLKFAIFVISKGVESESAIKNHCLDVLKAPLGENLLII